MSKTVGSHQGPLEKKKMYKNPIVNLWHFFTIGYNLLHLYGPNGSFTPLSPVFRRSSPVRSYRDNVFCSSGLVNWYNKPSLNKWFRYSLRDRFPHVWSNYSNYNRQETSGLDYHLLRQMSWSRDHRYPYYPSVLSFPVYRHELVVFIPPVLLVLPVV